jgi:Fe-S cluster biosynthesis and repair protein YggX
MLFLSGILIDVGQDFEADWLRLVSLLINEDTQSLLLVEDRAQTFLSAKAFLFAGYRLKLSRKIKGTVHQLSKHPADCKVCLGILP